MAESPTAGPSTIAATGRSSSRVKVKSQRALESEDTTRLLLRAKERARAAAAAAAIGEGSVSGSNRSASLATDSIGVEVDHVDGTSRKKRKVAKVGKRGIKSGKEGEVWCICRSGDGSGPMIECGECNDWYVPSVQALLPSLPRPRGIAVI